MTAPAGVGLMYNTCLAAVAAGRLAEREHMAKQCYEGLMVECQAVAQTSNAPVGKVVETVVEVVAAE